MYTFIPSHQQPFKFFSKLSPHIISCPDDEVRQEFQRTGSRQTMENHPLRRQRSKTANRNNTGKHKSFKNCTYDICHRGRPLSSHTRIHVCLTAVRGSVRVRQTVTIIHICTHFVFSFFFFTHPVHLTTTFLPGVVGMRAA